MSADRDKDSETEAKTDTQRETQTQTQTQRAPKDGERMINGGNCFGLKVRLQNKSSGKKCHLLITSSGRRGRGGGGR